MFTCKTKIVMGQGCVSCLSRLECRRLLVVSDPYFMKNGTAQRIAALTQAEETEFFAEIQPDPAVTLVARGTALMRSFQPDLLVALGGGSALDCAKAMEYFSGVKAYFAAIPTTSGSGSEVTDFAIVTHDGIKHPLVDESLRPDLAILDGSLLDGLPSGLIADTGFDVLSHCLEALVGKNRNPISDALALHSLQTVFRDLPASFGGETKVRQAVHTASAMAGLAFSQAGLGLCHGMSHALGARFHVPHGRLNAILLPEVVALNGCAALYARAARSLGGWDGPDAMGPRALRTALIRLRKNLHLPASLGEAGIAREELEKHREEILDSVTADPCCQTNPIPVDRALAGALLRKAAGNG